MFLWVLNREARTHGRVLRAPHYKYITYTWFVENNNSALKPSPPRHVFCFLLRSVVSVVFGVFFFLFCYPSISIDDTCHSEKERGPHKVYMYIYKKKKQYENNSIERRGVVVVARVHRIFYLHGYLFFANKVETWARTFYWSYAHRVRFILYSSCIRHIRVLYRSEILRGRHVFCK